MEAMSGSPKKRKTKFRNSLRGVFSPSKNIPKNDVTPSNEGKRKRVDSSAEASGDLLESKKKWKNVGQLTAGCDVLETVGLEPKELPNIEMNNPKKKKKAKKMNKSSSDTKASETSDEPQGLALNIFRQSKKKPQLQNDGGSNGEVHLKKKMKLKKPLPNLGAKEVESAIQKLEIAPNLPVAKLSKKQKKAKRLELQKSEDVEDGSEEPSEDKSSPNKQDDDHEKWMDITKHTERLSQLLRSFRKSKDKEQVEEFRGLEAGLTKLMRKSMRASKLPGLDVEPELVKYDMSTYDDEEDDIEGAPIPGSSDTDGQSSEEDGSKSEGSEHVSEDGNMDAQEDDDSDDEEAKDSEDDENNDEEEEEEKQKFDSPEKLSRTIFVGNIPLGMTQKMLKNVFKPFGKVESVRFRGAVAENTSIPKKVANIKHEYHEDLTSLKGYVVFKSVEEANKALSLNGTVVNGNHLRVDKATGGKPAGGKPAVAASKGCTAFIGNLPFKVSDEDIWSFFAKCGKVQAVRIVRDKESGIGKGFGFVEFQDRESVVSAIGLNDTEFQGRQIRVKFCEDKKDSQRPHGGFQRSWNRDGGQGGQRYWNRGQDGGQQGRKPWSEKFRGQRAGNSPNDGGRDGDNRSQGKKFGYTKFKQDRFEAGSRKTFGKFMNKRKMEHKKKEISSLFQPK